ncbi:MAG: M24 family metallopeptidase [Pyrinomonadaceae bacterium]|nr:M24 family metallopeptidase [Pyrinomonadaceae bacterium]
MKSKLCIVLIVLALTGSVFGYSDVVETTKKRYIKPAPPFPAFTTAERHTELAARRKKVADSMEDNSVLVLFSAPAKIYTNDVDYHYRQENNLYYLTALKQNGVTLVILKIAGDVNELILLPKRNPQFETWNGRMYSNEDATMLSGIRNIADAKNRSTLISAIRIGDDIGLDGVRVNGSGNVYLLTGNPREFAFENELVKSIPERRLRNASPIFARMRLVKSPYEIKILQHSIDITTEALMRSMGMVSKANFEYEVQAELEFTFRRRNAEYWGFPSIVGCGPNATTLHYIESQGGIRKDDLLLMDVGAEFDHYTADITRTFPVDGKFSKPQKEIYQIVYDAQEAAARTLKPGSTFGRASSAARNVIIDGLYELGLITDKASRMQVGLWFMHGWGHWLGMNVHDVGNYGTTLKEGMVMTNEPGIYVRENALDFLPDTAEWNEFKAKIRPAFERYKGIGVRIEDDMLITKDGVEWMSKGLPRQIEEVEKFMKGARKEMRRYALQRPSSKADISNVLAVKYGDVSRDLAAAAGVTVKQGIGQNGKSVFFHSH